MNPTHRNLCEAAAVLLVKPETGDRYLIFGVFHNNRYHTIVNWAKPGREGRWTVSSAKPERSFQRLFENKIRDGYIDVSRSYGLPIFVDSDLVAQSVEPVSGVTGWARGRLRDCFYLSWFDKLASADLSNGEERYVAVADVDAALELFPPARIAFDEIIPIGLASCGSAGLYLVDGPEDFVACFPHAAEVPAAGVSVEVAETALTLWKPGQHPDPLASFETAVEVASRMVTVTST